MSFDAMAWAARAECDNAIEKLVLIIAASFAGPDGSCYPSHKTIAKRACCSEKSVERSLKAFESRGWIERYQRRRQDGYRTSDLIVFMTFPKDETLPDHQSVRIEFKKPHPTVSPISPDCESPPTTLEVLRLTKDIVVSEEPTLSPSPRRSYPDAFEEVWKAYPHHKGRSSKPKALAEWKRMPAQERDGLMGAISAFSRNVDKVCGGMGAPCMARWMNHGKHLNWIEEANPTVSPSPSFVKTWNGPDRLREMVVRERGEGFAVSYIDRATWDGEAILAHNDLAVEKLKDVRCLTGVVIKNSA